MAGFFQEDEILGKAYDGRLMRRLLAYLRPYKGPVAIAFVLLVFLSIADIAPPIITKFLIDSAIAPAVNGDIPAAEGLRLLVPLGAAYLGVLLASAALRYAQNILTTYVGQRAMYDLRVQLFGHLQSLSLSFFDRNPVGRLMTRITNDIDALTDMVTQGVVSIFGDFLMLIGIAVVLLFLDWRLALLTYATLPIIVALTFYFRKTMRESFRSIRIRLARINAYLNENISGMSIVQLFTREPRAYRQFDELNTDLLNANQGAIKAMSLFFPAVTFTRAGAASAIFIAGGYWALGGQLTIGTLLAFWQLLDQFFRPIQDLSEKYNILQSAMASSERVFRLLDTEATIVDAPHPIALPSV
ncbi:MAG TPA: ABC transporter ATP-binding protein, partial [Candidatus Limnocylindria bacterium]